MTPETSLTAKRKRDLVVYLFNVGQGDNILLRLPNREYGIIDFFYEPSLNLSEPPALTYLKRVRRRLNPTIPLVISFVCLSHPDTDHIKGAKQLLDWIKDKRNNVLLRNLWIWPGTVLEDLLEQYEEYAHSIKQSDSTQRASEVRRQIRAVLKFGESFKNTEQLQDIRKLAQNAGGSIKAITVAPLGTHVRRFNKRAQRAFVKFATGGQKHKSPPKNVLSSILMLIYEEHRLIFGGDTMLKMWEECIERYYSQEHNLDHGELKGNFIKASHHGSKHSSSVELWPQILLPQVKGQVGISAGRRKRYGHPHRDTLVHIKSVAPPVECPELLSTNSCSDCVTEGLKKRKRQNLNWVGKRQLFKEPVKPDVVDSFKESSKLEQPTIEKVNTPAASLAPEEDEKLYLAAYIYRFRANDAVRVVNGVTDSVGSDESCPYKSRDSNPFPDCILEMKKVS